MTAANLYITIGADQVKEKGWRNMLQDMLRCDGDRVIYWWRLGNQPKREINEVFIVVGNKVRVKAKFAGYADGGETTFDDGRTMYAKCWMLLFDFELLPAPHKKRKGFQGFRYEQIEY